MKRILAALPDVRDLHVYGGLALVAYGLGSWGLAVVGAALWWYGIFRMRGA